MEMQEVCLIKNLEEYQDMLGEKAYLSKQESGHCMGYFKKRPMMYNKQKFFPGIIFLCVKQILEDLLMSEEIESNRLPSFLETFDNLTAHFDEHFGDLGSNERGESFLNLVQKLLPLSEEFSAFPVLLPSPRKSHDQGVDLLTSESRDNRILCAQSKYKLREKAAFDTVISKFKDFETSLCPPPAAPDLFPDINPEMKKPVPTFAVVTSSKLDNIIEKYEKSTLASKEYYYSLRKDNRLTILDGPRILVLLQQLYRKAHLIPSDVEIFSPSGWFNSGQVYFGAVHGKALTDLYVNHGDALFFENIRDFLGVSSGRVVTTRSTVNQEIIRTISEQPDRMLVRNNGITFRATEAIPGSKTKLLLKKAAIVNGCQTTMCLVHCQPVAETCMVSVKIVVTEDAWDIAKAANYQNPVARVDLDLARYLRPQLVRRVAANLGYAIETASEESASAVLNTIYQNKIDYDELRLLYLGFFSRKPNNIFEANYTELRADVLEELYEMAENEEKIFSVILMLLNESRRGLDDCQTTFSGEEYVHLFKRFYKDDKPTYRSFLAVTAACTAIRDDISRRSLETKTETEHMRSFLGKCREILENNPDDFRKAYRHAFAAVADSLLDVQSGKSDTDIQQTMFQKVSSMSFDSLYKRVLMRIDAGK